MRDKYQISLSVKELISSIQLGGMSISVGPHTVKYVSKEKKNIKVEILK